jgi:3-phenylpropionate/trans-cinnamate dioxygenase ferredoxin subunit
MSFERACSAADVPDGGVIRVDVDGLDVAVVRNGDDIYNDIESPLNAD